MTSALRTALKRRLSGISSLKEHQGFMKYFANTGWMFLGQSTMVISLFINIWMARNLGPTNFGRLSYVFAFAGIFSFIANFGINDILIRDIVRHPENRNKLLGTAFNLLMFGGILAFAASSASILLVEHDPLIKTLVIIYSTIFLWSPVNVIAAYFQATVQAKRNAQAQMIGTIISSCIKVFILATGKGIVWLTIAFTLDYVIGCMLYIWNYFKSDLEFKKWVYDKAVARAFFYSSFFIMLSSAAGYILLKIDQVMIKFYLDEAAVGLYSVAVKLSEIWYFIPSIICGSLFPAIINAKKSGEVVYRKRLRGLYAFLGIMAFCIALPVTFLAPYVVGLLYGAAYMASVPILQIYIWSGVGLFLMTGINRYFMAENYLKSILTYSIISVVTNISLNVVFIPTIGVSGAAWATLVSYLISPILVFTLHSIKRPGPNGAPLSTQPIDEPNKEKSAEAETDVEAMINPEFPNTN